MTREKLIIHNNVLLAKLILGDNWNEGLSFYSNEKDFIQVLRATEKATLDALGAGKFDDTLTATLKKVGNEVAAKYAV